MYQPSHRISIIDVESWWRFVGCREVLHTFCQRTFEAASKGDHGARPAYGEMAGGDFMAVLVRRFLRRLGP